MDPTAIEELLLKAKRRYMQYSDLDEEEIDRFIEEVMNVNEE